MTAGTDGLLLIDSDLFVLLSAAGLLDELVGILGFPISAERRLSALPHVLRKGRHFRQFDESVRHSALQRCDQILALDDRPADNDVFNRLLDAKVTLDGVLHEIDGGEAFFLASLAERPACLLTTGDRRALIALGQASELDDVREKVRGRIVSLETALILLINQLGADPVGRRFAMLKGCHRTIDIFFGHKISFETKIILEEINSSRNDLTRRMGDDLLFPI